MTSFLKAPYRIEFVAKALLVLFALCLGVENASAGPHPDAKKADISANQLILDPAGNSLLWGHSPLPLKHLELNSLISFHYVNQPLMIQDGSTGKIIRRLINHQESVHVGIAVGLWKWAEAGITLPFIGYQEGRYPAIQSGKVATTGLGDTDAYVQSKILEEGDWPINLGAQLSFRLPTGNAKAYMGTGRVSIEPGIIASRQVGPVTVEGALGYRSQAKATIFNLVDDDQLTYRFSGRYPLPYQLWTVQLDWIGTTPSSSPFGSAAQSPSELIGVSHYEYSKSLGFFLGGGVGISSGIRTPTFRLLAGISINSVSNVDDDFDGIPQYRDKCPEDPEDFDEFEDADGCPEGDNDKDGLPDEGDTCPEEPEDIDQWQDEDGCPDPDNDEDEILDIDDKCPDEPEDKDDFQDDDGCPEADNDEDGLLDADDKCPNEPETINNLEDEDGCPDSGDEDELVKVIDGKITVKLDGVVFFEVGSAFLKRPARPVLNQLVATMKNQKRIEKLYIIGHTDDKGSKKLNERLSKKRAKAVRRYLLKRGITPERIEILGQGAGTPKASNKKKWGRRVNRRVDFRIGEWASEEAQEETPTEEEAEGSEAIEEPPPEGKAEDGESTDETPAEEEAEGDGSTDEAPAEEEAEGDESTDEKSADEEAEGDESTDEESADEETESDESTDEKSADEEAESDESTDEESADEVTESDESTDEESADEEAESDESTDEESADEEAESDESTDEESADEEAKSDESSEEESADEESEGDESSEEESAEEDSEDDESQ